MSKVDPAVPAQKPIPTRLECGVEFEGKLHSEFELRLPTMADNLAVFDELPEGNALALNIAILARCLTRLGDIPLSQVKEPNWLASVLIDDDYDVLWPALQDLKKKRKALNNVAVESNSPC